MAPYTNHAWEHANDVRTVLKMKRRAVFLAAVQSNLPKAAAAKAVGISFRTASRYLSEVRDAS